MPADGGHCTVDITTFGARTARPRRTEIWLYRVGQRWYLTGRPERRDWYANLGKHPGLMVRPKRDSAGDLAATARVVTDDQERRKVLSPIVSALNRMDRPGVPQFDFDEWAAGSPLAEVIFDDSTAVRES